MPESECYMKQSAAVITEMIYKKDNNTLGNFTKYQILIITNIKHHHTQLKVKGKGKVIPLQARCGPEGGERYSCTLP